MNDYELIGRLADLDNRLRQIEGRPIIQEQPQPAVPTLVEEARTLIAFWKTSHIPSNQLIEQFQALERAVNREKDIVEKREDLLRALHQQGFPGVVLYLEIQELKGMVKR